MRALALAHIALSVLAASGHRGQVTFRGLPVPGASVSACNSVSITDAQGYYSFRSLSGETCLFEISMFGFAPIRQEAPAARFATWALTMLPLSAPTARREDAPPRPELAPAPDDGLLIAGSVNNTASSPFSLPAAFGNNRFSTRRLYNGGIAFTLGNAAFDARPFSLTGREHPKASYNRMTGGVSFAGPLPRPGPNVFLNYQWTRNNNATTASALVPTAAERDASSPQARELLRFYPLPNSTGAGYNYQVALLSPTHQDALQSRFMKSLGARNQFFGNLNFQSTRSDSTNVFGFLDKTGIFGINTAANWYRRLSTQWFLNIGVQFSRLATRVTPYFQNRRNVSAEAGITGNSQDPLDWGPPALRFSSGIAALADAQSSFTRNRTTGVSGSVLWNRRGHNITFGGDFRRQQFNHLSQEDARGTFTFTGPFSDFLAGIPSTASIAFGNADKYLRQSVHDAYFTDDWRTGPSLTVNAGLRWEYGAPVTEIYGRLINLAVAPGFAAAAPVRASLDPFRHGFAPRIGIAWRPIAGSPMIVRAGYGIYYDTSIYENIALRLSQQPPLSRTFSVQNSADTPLTLSFDNVPAGGSTFAADSRFRPGYAQNWQVSIQRDLPYSLQLTSTYLGIKGTHTLQSFLPNTYPDHVFQPSGFVYVASGGNSIRHAGQMQLRRRLRRGLAATLQYTFAKHIDTGSGIQSIAQNWLDLAAERGLANTDQRHLLTLQSQYTLRRWTVASEITAGPGFPQTPIYLAPVQGTGITGTIRPDSIAPGVYSPPRPGRWGNAGRNTIRGPAQFSLNASLARTFEKLEVRADATNLLNHVTYTQWNTVIQSPQFGLPAAANPMRTLQTTARWRF